jgi:DNA excision repair protein ERCC-3
MYYSTKRQQFLVDQGYAFKVITNLVPDGQTELLYSSQRDQLELLREVLTAASSAEVAAEDAAETEEVRTATGAGAGPAGGSAVSRKRTSISALSGGDTLSYGEVNRAGKAAQQQQRHGVFKQIDKARKQQRGA